MQCIHLTLFDTQRDRFVQGTKSAMSLSHYHPRLLGYVNGAQTYPHLLSLPPSRSQGNGDVTGRNLRAGPLLSLSLVLRSRPFQAQCNLRLPGIRGLLGGHAGLVAGAIRERHPELAAEFRNQVPQPTAGPREHSVRPSWPWTLHRRR
jgi:hypothetical protein